jgi:dephospho-CoA kinase
MTGFRLGLTGSIGMGKSTTAAMFRAQGIPVWDADATVHALYAVGGAAVAIVSDLYPDAIKGGAVSRDRLRNMILQDPDVLDTLQAAIHPLVAADRNRFLQEHPNQIVLLDIPLLFETGADAQCDGTVVVTVSPDIQQKRVLDRGQMTLTEFHMILARQMPDVEKRKRATWVVETTTIDAAQKAVLQILADIRQRNPDA